MPSVAKHRRSDELMPEAAQRDFSKKEYINELMNRIESKYEENQRAKERQLAEIEKKRVRKLALEGIVTPEQLRESDDFNKSVWRHHFPPPRNITVEQWEEEERRREEQKRLQEQAAEEERRRQEQERQREEQLEAERQRQQQEEQQLQQQQQAAAGSKFNRIESARITALREEQDLSEMYRKAGELVYIMRPVKAKK